MTTAFPLALIFNIVITIILASYWIITFTILYHLNRFGVGVQPKRFAATFLLGSIVFSSSVIVLLTTTDLSVLLPR